MRSAITILWMGLCTLPAWAGKEGGGGNAKAASFIVQVQKSIRVMQAHFTDPNSLVRLAQISGLTTKTPVYCGRTKELKSLRGALSAIDRRYFGAGDSKIALNSRGGLLVDCENTPYPSYPENHWSVSTSLYFYLRANQVSDFVSDQQVSEVRADQKFFDPYLGSLLNVKKEILGKLRSADPSLLPGGLNLKGLIDSLEAFTFEFQSETKYLEIRKGWYVFFNGDWPLPISGLDLGSWAYSRVNSLFINPSLKKVAVVGNANAALREEQPPATWIFWALRS